MVSLEKKRDIYKAFINKNKVAFLNYTDRKTIQRTPEEIPEQIKSPFFQLIKSQLEAQKIFISKSRIQEYITTAEK